jgi:hypothetical protein
LAVAAYVAVLLWAYATVVSPAFAYNGYTLTWPNAGGMTWLLTIALLPTFGLPYSLTRPSALILWWLYLAAYVPSILVPALTLSTPLEFLLPLHVSLLLCMGLLSFASSGRLLAIGRIALSPTLFWSVMLTVWAMCVAYVCANGRAGLLMVNIASLFAGGNEYSIRSTYLAERSTALAYLVGQLGQAIDPFLIGFGIVYRRRLFLVGGIIGQVVVFALTGFKSILFSSVFLAFLFAIARRWRRSFGFALATGLTVIVLTCAAVDRATDGVLLSSLITRRTLAAPGLLTGFYFEHFSQVPHAGVAYRFSRWPPPYSGPPQEIGLVYFGSAEIDANANMWAEGFADFGIPGIVGFTLLVAFLIRIYDSIASRHDLLMATLLAAMPALNLSNTAPTTVLFTHGALLAALLLYVFPAGESTANLDPEGSSEILTEDEMPVATQSLV